MRRASLAGEIRQERALLSLCEFVSGRLPDNDEVRFPLQFIRFSGAVAAAFLAYHEEEAEVVDSLASKSISRFNHCRDDSLGVAGSAPVEEVLVLADRQDRWNSVHVRAQNHARRSGKRKDVEAIR